MVNRNTIEEDHFTLLDGPAGSEQTGAFSLYCPGCGERICELEVSEIENFRSECGCGARLEVASTPVIPHSDVSDSTPSSVPTDTVQEFLRDAWKRREDSRSEYGGITASWVHEQLADAIGM